jgi:hypothetical protein
MALALLAELTVLDAALLVAVEELDVAFER